jgi:hypothetical protein
MFHTATLTAHRGATLVTRDELAQYEPPEAEGRGKPVKHSLIVDLMHEELAWRQIQVTKEEYAIQREGNYHIPSDLVVEGMTAHRKPPEVRIWRLRNQSWVGTFPPSTSTPHGPACWARR